MANDNKYNVRISDGQRHILMAALSGFTRAGVETEDGAAVDGEEVGLLYDMLRELTDDGDLNDFTA